MRDHRYAARVSWMVLVLSGCFVDGSVIDDLPCECAPGFECDSILDRCVPELDGRDPDLGDCLVVQRDDFEGADINEALWGSTTDDAAEVSVEDGAFVGRVPANSVSDYAFLFARERVDFTNCTALVELVYAPPGEDGITFFSARINNNEGSFGFGVRNDELRASFSTGGSSMSVWTTPYDPDVHRWFALRGDAGDIVWLTSADGVQWIEVAREPAPIDLSNLQPLFGLGAARDGEAVEARFDNYNTLP